VGVTREKKCLLTFRGQHLLVETKLDLGQRESKLPTDGVGMETTTPTTLTEGKGTHNSRHMMARMGCFAGGTWSIRFYLGWGAKGDLHNICTTRGLLAGADQFKKDAAE